MDKPSESLQNPDQYTLHTQVLSSGTRLLLGSKAPPSWLGQAPQGAAPSTDAQTGVGKRRVTSSLPTRQGRRSAPLQPTHRKCPPPQPFPGGSDGKESTCSAGDLGSIPGLRRSPGGGCGNSLQHSCLENPTDRGAWRATVHGVTESDTTEQRSGLKTNQSRIARLFLLRLAPPRHAGKSQPWELLGEGPVTRGS